MTDARPSQQIDNDALQHIVHIEKSMAMAKLSAQMFMTALQQLDGYEWGFRTVLTEMESQNKELILKFLEESGLQLQPSEPCPF